MSANEPASSTSLAASSSTTSIAPITMNNGPTTMTGLTTSVDAQGQVHTVSQNVVHASSTAGSSNDSSTTSKSFLSNSGAVAGVFVALGLAITAAIILFAFCVYRKRRRHRINRDVREHAALASSRSSSRRDMEKDVAMPISVGTAKLPSSYSDIDVHHAPQSMPASYGYEDPTGGFDNYANDMATAGDRMSMATTAGMAGFGAQSAATAYTRNNAGAYDFSQSQPIHEGYEEMDRNAAAYDQQGQGGVSGYYFDPRDADEYSEAGDDDYLRPPSGQMRPLSAGTVDGDAGRHRDLTVTNL